MSHVRVRLKVRGVSLEYSGEESFFDRWVDPLLSAAAGPASAPRFPGSAAAPVATAPGPAPVPVAKPAEPPPGFRPSSHDFGHFIRQLGPEAGEVDRQVVAFAFYLWNYEKREEFSEEEIAGCFRALGLAPPAEAGEVFRDLADRKRFLDPGAAERRWRLTQKGRNYVKTRLFAGA